MKYGLNIGYLMKKIPFETVLDMVKKAGFTDLDYQPDYKREDWEANAYKEIDAIAKAGLCIHQTHAPFNRYRSHTKEDYKIYLERLFCETEMAGAKYMVVHGDEFEFDTMEYTPEKALQYNYELFAPYVERAAKSGIKLAFETVFEDFIDDATQLAQPRFCSDFDDLCAMIGKFNSDNVCCCWDFGHAGLSFGDKHAENIEKMGKLIECTHVQDYGHNDDLHLPPFLGENDWSALMAALGKAGYTGNLTFEMVYGAIPEALGDAFAEYLMETAKVLSSLMK